MPKFDLLAPPDDEQPAAPAKPGLFVKMPLEILTNKAVSASALKLWAKLAKFAWRDGSCFPGQARLAEEMNLSERRIRDLVRELETAALVTTSPKPSRYKTTSYQLVPASGQFVKLPLALLDDYPISPESMRLWLILKKHAHRFSAYWPTQGELAAEMQLSPRRIRDLLSELEENDLLNISRNAAANLGNIYRLKDFDNNRQKTATTPAKNFRSSRQETSATPAENFPQPRQKVAAKTESKPESLESQQHGAPAKISSPVKNGVCEITNFSNSKTSSEKLLQLVDMLKMAGVATPRAAKLVAQLCAKGHDESYLQAVIVASQKPTVRDAAAYLVYMLENNMTPKEAAKPQSLLPAIDARLLPRLIQIEERNLAEARNERERCASEEKLAHYRTLLAQERRN